MMILDHWYYMDHRVKESQLLWHRLSKMSQAR